MPKRYLNGGVKNLLHEYHQVIDSQTGEIDQTEWKNCKCKYCSFWTPDVLKAYASYEAFLIEEKQKVDSK
jgi:hypothetical protein